MTEYLLDTCTLIDWAIDPKRLNDGARVAIGDGRAIVYVSAATAWEISIKKRLGKMKSAPDVESLVKANRFIELPISVVHGEATASLPMLHRDPFDRLLIAQARVEKLVLVTRDETIQKYDVQTLAA
jgi:PIN domain nuclease of toxin-antitoxin system